MPVQTLKYPVTDCLIQELQKKNRPEQSKANLVWLELTGCSGNIISLLDGHNPNFQYLITDMVDLIYSNSLMSAEGDAATRKLKDVINTPYILAVEGAVATANNGYFNIIGSLDGKLLTALSAVKLLGARALHVIAVGACASHGGVSAAKPNPASCVSVASVLRRKVIQLPGCPCHPDWFTGTLAHLLLYGEPELDSRNRPVMFYLQTIHDHCERRSFFDKGIFAAKLGDEGCMFKLGCRGPVTPIDCPIRKWNGHINWPVGSSTPCIGCAQFGFPDKMEPFISYDIGKSGE